MHLVADEVLQSLIMHQAHEDRRFQGLASNGIEEQLVASVMEAVLAQFSAHAFDRHTGKRSSIPHLGLHATEFTQQALEELSNGHSTGKTVRRYDDVRDDAVHGEGHVDFRKNHANDALLTMMRGELVPNLRYANGIEAHTCEPRTVLV